MAWNQRAARVFVAHFISLDDNKNYSAELVHKTFRAHLSNLKEQFMMQEPSIRLSPQQKDKDRFECSYLIHFGFQLVDRRVETFLQISLGVASMEDLRKAIYLITAESVSGDETADQDRKQFFITSMGWRSQECSDFLANLSALHLSSRYLGNGKYQRGVFPHSRYFSNRPESVYDRDGARTGLPINWYNPSWLNAHPNRKQAIQPTKAVSLALPGRIVHKAFSSRQDLKGSASGASGTSTIQLERTCVRFRC
ncbi:hypothetical protein BDP27DRAFT_1433700 [Rhodocollybia butyracea]|uniref:Uncharacterized protein n=1 Tax=Rhodocollybia butyracea TaxID=206335 RepID=A0A9P5TW27_9AGAR|nr:hypothetical protein BDP27DRAFT_1433700 [Rhodocollybia butyracea]